jgi:hypothetical protein
MEKFMLINRDTGTNAGASASDMEQWIHSLKASGNYVSGMSIEKSSGESRDNILRIDTILAENPDQASSLAKTCPWVVQGLVEIEVRMIIPLLR